MHRAPNVHHKWGGLIATGWIGSWKLFDLSSNFLPFFLSNRPLRASLFVPENAFPSNETETGSATAPLSQVVLERETCPSFRFGKERTVRGDCANVPDANHADGRTVGRRRNTFTRDRPDVTPIMRRSCAIRLRLGSVLVTEFCKPQRGKRGSSPGNRRKTKFSHKTYNVTSTAEIFN